MLRNCMQGLWSWLHWAQCRDLASNQLTVAVIICSVGVPQPTALGTDLVPASRTVCILFSAGLCLDHRTFLSFPFSAHWWRTTPIKAACVSARTASFVGGASEWMWLSGEPWSRDPAPDSCWAVPHLAEAGPGAVPLPLIQNWPCRLGTDLQLDFRLQSYSLSDSSSGTCQGPGRGLWSLSLTQLFPCILYYWLNCGSQSWISLPFPLKSVSGKNHLCTWESREKSPPVLALCLWSKS